MDGNICLWANQIFLWCAADATHWKSKVESRACRRHISPCVCVCAWCGHKNMIIITVIIVCCVEMDSATATMSFPNSNAAYFCFTIFAVMRSSHCMFVCFFDGFCCFSILIDVERSAMKLQFVRVWWLWGPLNHVAFMGFHRRRLFGNDIVQQPRFTANSPCKLL